MNRTKQSSIRRLMVVVTTGLAVSLAGGAAAALGLGGVCCAPPAVAAPAPTHDSRGGVADANDLAVTIEIPEVDCAGCNVDVRKALKGAGGVRRLNEGSPKNRIVVTYEPGSGRPDVYVEALHKAGFAKAHVAG